MIVSIHQPNYLPWLGLIDKIAVADVFIFLDDAQYSNEARHNRNSIKTANGSAYLTVPVNQHLGDKIDCVHTKDALGWKEKHLKTIAMNYKRAPYFDQIYPMMEALLQTEYDNIADMNEAIIRCWVRQFGIQTQLYRSSEYAIASVRQERLFDLCDAVSGDCYYSGNGARHYQNTEDFNRRGIRLVYQKFQVEPYPQLWGEFIPNLSALDYMMNCGFVLPSRIQEHMDHKNEIYEDNEE